MSAKNTGGATKNGTSAMKKLQYLCYTNSSKGTVCTTKNSTDAALVWYCYHTKDKIDPGQYGGLPGNSITHYLIELINFILYNLDLQIPHAILLTMVDFSKAFNRIDHHKVIIILHEMNVPGWLLRIIVSYLQSRSMILRFNGANSTRKSLPGGSPQGALLGVIIFLLQINKAGMSSYPGPYSDSFFLRNKRKPIHSARVKFVDDLTVAQSINLKDNLVNDDNPVRPVTYDSRTEHILPTQNLLIQQQLEELKKY